MVIEITKSERWQREYINNKFRAFGGQIEWEKLDKDTYNATLIDDEVDALTDLLEAYNLEWRLI